MLQDSTNAKYLVFIYYLAVVVNAGFCVGAINPPLICKLGCSIDAGSSIVVPVLLTIAPYKEEAGQSKTHHGLYLQGQFRGKKAQTQFHSPFPKGI